jgi:hypothetical protein
MMRSTVRSRTAGVHAPRSHTRLEKEVAGARTSISYLWPASGVKRTVANPARAGSLPIVKDTACGLACSFHRRSVGSMGFPSRQATTSAFWVTLTSTRGTGASTGTASSARTGMASVIQDLPRPACTRSRVRGRAQGFRTCSRPFSSRIFNELDVPFADRIT